MVPLLVAANAAGRQDRLASDGIDAPVKPLGGRTVPGYSQAPIAFMECSSGEVPGWQESVLQTVAVATSEPAPRERSPAVNGLLQAVPATANRPGSNGVRSKPGLAVERRHDLADDRGPGEAAPVEARRHESPGGPGMLPIRGRPSAVKPMIPAQARTTRTPASVGKRRPACGDAGEHRRGDALLLVAQPLVVVEAAEAAEQDLAVRVWRPYSLSKLVPKGCARIGGTAG